MPAHDCRVAALRILPATANPTLRWINFETVAPRLDAHVRSQVDGLFYDKQRSANQVFNTLDASTQVALVLQRLFLDAFAIYDQTVVEPTGKSSFNKLALTGNRTDVGIVALAPRVVWARGRCITAIP